MKWMTKLQLLKFCCSQSEVRQEAMLEDCVNLSPGSSSRDDWHLYLARMFGVGSLDIGPLNQGRLVQRYQALSINQKTYRIDFSQTS